MRWVLSTFVVSFDLKTEFVYILIHVTKSSSLRRKSGSKIELFLIRVFKKKSETIVEFVYLALTAKFLSEAHG